MKTIKDRKIFALSNFMGMDSENKEVKVAPFRATDGKNFIIDSGTLKTRPSINHLVSPLKDVVGASGLVDFYNFRDLKVYITYNNIYVKYRDVILTTNTMPNFITSFPLGGFNLTDNKPLFQEEKDCLFIFCINDIIVLSNIYDKNNQLKMVVAYSINNKPSNPFDKETQKEEYKSFEDLPTPYIPTLFIGDNRLDDANLLSNKYRYKMFAKSEEEPQEEFATYYLPTVYDGNEEYKNEITFYPNKYPNLKYYPVFLGKEKENFNEPLSNFGETINQENPIKIAKGYYAKENFEYSKDNDIVTPIKEILGLTKKDFYDLRVIEEESDIVKPTVFEKILSRINILDGDTSGENPNKILVFSLPYSCTKVYKDKTTNEIIKIEKSEDNEVKIYVQLKIVNIINKNISNKKILSNTKIYIGSGTIPDFPKPTLPGAMPIEISPLETMKEGYSDNDFREIANEYIANIFNSPKGNYYIKKILSEEYEEYQQGQTSFLNRPDEWALSDTEEVAGGDISSYPKVENTTGLKLFTSDKPIYIGGLDSFGEQINASLYNNEILSQIEKYMVAQDSVDVSQGAYQFYLYGTYRDYGGTFYEFGMTGIVKFSYTYGGYVTKTKKTSYIMEFTSNDKKDSLVKDDLYKIIYDKNTNSFVLKLRNYFYNYSKEPVIEILSTINDDKNYKIIANSKFGITFGSENRLFLAGNKEYPNIDRYNVSNDLLGDNVKNQSYELSYFPSKNYRVLGGKGAINGYVIGTDTQLYVSKVNYPNDQKLFVRTRVMDDKGIVGYNEFKTNIGITPLNNKCLARFYNDIVALSTDGLYGLEITDNVLTNERLIRLRSSFINKELKEAIKNYKDEIFVFEDNKHLDIVIGNTLYVADSRYVDKNPYGEISNYSYEFVKWELPKWVIEENIETGEKIYKKMEIKLIKKIGETTYLLDKEGKNIYIFENKGFDTYYNYDSKKIERKPIELQWQSALLNFGNNLYEKTLFKTNVFAIKQKDYFIYEEYKPITEETKHLNSLKLGYRTMRRYNSFENINKNPNLDLSDAMNMNELDFNIFAINTFSNFGSSIPTKENNFLYIQFLIIGAGNIEVNEIEFEYKNNRLLKTIG